MAGLTSLAEKAFLSLKCNSFHTTSTPSSVSMARKVLWTPGMFPWFTWRWGRGEAGHECAVRVRGLALFPHPSHSPRGPSRPWPTLGGS